jgi:hypothetical protein
MLLTSLKPSPGLRSRVVGVALLAMTAGCSDSITSSGATPFSIDVPNQALLLESLGAETAITARVLDRGGRVIPDVRLAVEVLDRGVAAAAENGRIVGLNNGETRVRVRIADPNPSVSNPGYHSGRLVVEVPLTVRQRAATVQVRDLNNGNIWLWGVGQSLPLQALPVDPGGQPLQRVHNVVWSSANPAIATVDQRGVVTGVSEGEVLIRADVEGVVGVFRVYVSTTLTFSGCVSSGPMRFLDAAGTRARCDQDQTAIFRSGFFAASEPTTGGPS